MGGNATSPLHTRGSPKQRGTKSEVAASPLPSRRTTSGRKCYGTPAFSGTRKQRGTKSEVGTSPLPSWGATSGRQCYLTLKYSVIPKTKRDKIKSGYLTYALSGAHAWAEVLRQSCILGDPQKQGGQNQKWQPHTCLLGGPQVGGNATSAVCTRGSPRQRGTKSEVGTSPLPSRGPTGGRKCYVIPTYLGIPKKNGDKIRIGYLTLAFLGAHTWAEVLQHPYILGDPQKKAGTKLQVAASPLLSRRPTSGRKCYVTPAYLGIPKTKENKIRSGYLTLAVSRAHTWAEVPRHPYIPGDHQNKVGQNQKWPPHPCLLAGLQVSGNATSPVHTRGSPKQRGTKSEVGTSPLLSRGPTRGRKCRVTPTYPGITKTKWDKIRSGRLTLAFSRAYK